MDGEAHSVAEEFEIVRRFYAYFLAEPPNRNVWASMLLGPVGGRGFMEGFAEGRRCMLIENSLTVLRVQSMQLTKAQVAKLRRTLFYKLPDIEVAFCATSAADFAKRAGQMDGDAYSLAEEFEIVRGFFMYFLTEPPTQDVWAAELLRPVRGKSFVEGFAEGRRYMLVENLLSVLRVQSMQLTKAQMAELRRILFDELPDMKVAFHATSAVDFAKRAKLVGRAKRARRH